MTKPLSYAQGIWLVADREVGGKIRSRSYIISTAILLLVALAGVIWLGVLSGTTDKTSVAATPQSAQLLDQDEVEITEVAGRDEAIALVRAGDVDAAVLANSTSPTGVTIVADTSAPDELVAQFSILPDVEILSSDTHGFGIRYILGLAFGLVFMMAAISFGSPIATSVIEEKQSRIVEILLAAVPARVLLAGKVIGNAILAMVQILLLIAVIAAGLMITGQTALLQGLGAPVLLFAVFFVFGFLLIACMFAAAGSLVSRQEDAASVYTPMLLLTMVPFYGVIFLGTSPLAMTIMSYIPFSAPIAMPIRLFFGEAQWWEPLLSLGFLIATSGVVIVLAARIYENSLLKMGARVKLGEALRG